jgi:predicted aspartyl protease
VSFPFDADNGLIVVHAELFGPSCAQVLRLALDTGATATLINVGPLATVGYDPALTSERVQVTTGSNVEFLPQVEVTRLSALGQTRIAFLVLAHTLPPSAGVDGLLGLDFLRGQRLEIDFLEGSISLG